MFDYIYEWDNLKEDSPEEDVRNYWLYTYGAFGCYNGLWFACRVARKNTNGAPYSVIAVPISTSENFDVYPPGEIRVTDMDVLYSVFPNGQSIEYYISRSMRRKAITDKMLNGALSRSLNTEIVGAPRKLMSSVKRAANRQDKEEIYVVEDEMIKDKVVAIELPHTADIIEKLWNSNDWSIQEVSQLLGISYNPSHGKKERMLQAELLGDRDITLMCRRKLTKRLITAANKFGESVKHISTSIDVIDRGLSYEKEDESNVDNVQSITTGEDQIRTTINEQ